VLLNKEADRTLFVFTAQNFFPEYSSMFSQVELAHHYL